MSQEESDKRPLGDETPKDLLLRRIYLISKEVLEWRELYQEHQKHYEVFRTQIRELSLFLPIEDRLLKYVEHIPEDEQKEFIGICRDIDTIYLYLNGD